MESDDSSTASSVPPIAAMDFPLHGGERIEGVYHEVTYLSPSPMKGSLTVTNYRIYFRSSSSTSSPLILDVPLGFAARVEKVGGQRTAREGAYGLEIACKDIRSLRFALSKTDPRKDVFETLRRKCFPFSYEPEGGGLFAFQYKVNEGRDYRMDDGWRVYDPVSEYRRQGLPNEAWTISNINDNYEICDSYPRILGVPSSASDEDIREVAKFRSRGRFPVLSWMDPDSLASICRCAQPLVGVGGSRNHYDELYVQGIMDANAQSHRIWIMDARPKVNAMANILNGGGYENEDAYDNAELVFLDIHNIHTMRVSLRKVRDLSFPVIDDGKWLSNIDNTHWLDHLSSILSGAVRIAGKVHNSKTSVIVHCSDGWDRTSQLTALSMLFLDPYFRSLTGFMVLIEKEWLSFGHKFATRIGHGEDKPNDNDRSPVFLQFIDCVWQITNQFPHAFEFNEYFLTIVLDHLYSCLFGTFLYNSDKERRINSLRSKTKSIWSFIHSQREPFLNPSYNPDKKKKTLFPEPDVRYLRLWTGYYCRWNTRMRPQESLRKKQVQNVSVKDQLRSKVESLRKELESKRKVNNGGGGGSSSSHKEESSNLPSLPNPNGGGGAAISLLSKYEPKAKDKARGGGEPIKHVLL
eukprot:TRINITY_DN4420_c0_g1_i1.p1 TRINITY_DN4420_c0_g1~~TRINITY_DN4420_c0_g1_i1.p1  ORF type:complete len:635 (+),score=233.83 TRINITY_DN4420_c0_g1_i1:154-2058(+)